MQFVNAGHCGEEGLGGFTVKAPAQNIVVNLKSNVLKFKGNTPVKLCSICYFMLSLLEQLMENNKNINNRARFINWAGYSTSNEIWRIIQYYIALGSTLTRAAFEL